MLEAPVVLFVYNRPDTTIRVLEKIRECKPMQLIIVADGPKNEQEEQAVYETRALFEAIDWDCKLICRYSEINQGCAKSIASGLDFVFEKYENAIILEDDCVPSPSFFKFCNDLLVRYSNSSVMHISGNNLLQNLDIENSYFFTTCAFPPWGWATWKRAWQKYKAVITDWEAKASQFENQGLFIKNENPLWNRAIIANTKKGDTWDHQWAIALWENSGLAINPKNNLVSNIGFDNRAIHTRGNSEFANMPAETLPLNLKHPEFVKVDLSLNRAYYAQIEKFFKSLDIWH